MSNTVSYAGYTFTVYTKTGTTWNAKAGVYMFASLNSNQKWDVHYVGQCDSFEDRIPSHERWEDARRLGATHVLAVVVSLQADRDALEQHAIQDFQPPLNTHYR
jgi:excinuclease UvrABC nuclease subunit